MANGTHTYWHIHDIKTWINRSLNSIPYANVINHRVMPATAFCNIKGLSLSMADEYLTNKDIIFWDTTILHKRRQPTSRICTTTKPKNIDMRVKAIFLGIIVFLIKKCVRLFDAFIKSDAKNAAIQRLFFARTDTINILSMLNSRF